jgi:hypothetical protein
MPATVITGKDTLVLNGHVFHQLADGDCGKIVYDEDLTKLKVGKDGNAVFGQNQGGRAGTLTIRVLIGSADDKYLNGLDASYLSDSSGYVLDIGSLFKNLGDGGGNRNSVVYQLVGGAPKRQPEGKINADGDPNQSVTEWTWIFAQVARSII